MTIRIGYRNQRYDDIVPLYIEINAKFVFNRLTSKLMDKPALVAAMAADGHTPHANEIAPPSPGWARSNGWTYPVPPYPSTTATAGKPGSFDHDIPADLVAIKALGALGNTTKWTVDQWVVLADASLAHWNGTTWVVGKAPA
ncbi:MAG: hypothetical protein J7M20_00520 [Deltaproteobacteria bacterium]|nr:hypothetical protein [Deltaproteobacteria bacterium]